MIGYAKYIESTKTISFKVIDKSQQFNEHSIW